MKQYLWSLVASGFLIAVAGGFAAGQWVGHVQCIWKVLP